MFAGAVGRGEGHACAGEGRADGDRTKCGWGQRASDSGGVRPLTVCVSQRLALADEVDPAVIKVQIDVEVGMRREEGHDGRRQMSPAEGHRRPTPSTCL